MLRAGRRARQFLATIVVLIGAHANAAQDEHALGRVLARTAAEQAIPAAELAVVENGRLTYVARYRSQDGLLAPGAPPARFQVGSVSKPVAATAALALVDANRLDLDAPIVTLAQWTPPPSAHDSRGITLRRLLSHTAGLTLGGYYGFGPEADVPTTLQSLNGATIPPTRVELFQAPGAGYRYSGGGYTLMQHVLEAHEGRPFAEIVRAQVFDPLRMDDSSYAADHPTLASLVPHGTGGEPLPRHRFAALAAAGLWTTADDLARFSQALLGNTPLLRAATLRDQRVAVPVRTGPSPFGLGLLREDGGRVIGHSGSNIGWKAGLTLLPEENAALVVVTNGEGGAIVTAAVRCAWARAREPSVLEDSCTAFEASRRSSHAQLRVAQILLFVLTVLLGVRMFRAGRRPRTTAGLARRAAAGSLLLLTGAGAAFLLTPIGAALVAGAAVPGTTLDYVAQPLRATLQVALAGALLLATHIALTFPRAATGDSPGPVDTTPPRR